MAGPFKIQANPLTIEGEGIEVIDRPGVMLVAETASKQAQIAGGDIGGGWTVDKDFDDSGWTEGAGGVGYERSSGYENFIVIDLSAMFQQNSCCYIRIPFTVSGEDLATFNFMILKMRYDDGFAVYLNGQEIARSSNAPTPLLWNSQATAIHEDSEAVIQRLYDVSEFLGKLTAGENMLAIQGLNASVDSSDLLISAELVAGKDPALDEPVGGEPAVKTSRNWIPVLLIFLAVVLVAILTTRKKRK